MKVTYFKKQEGMEVPVPKQAVKLNLAESLSKFSISLRVCQSKTPFSSKPLDQGVYLFVRRRKFAHNGEG